MGTVPEARRANILAMKGTILNLFETYRTSAFETRGITRYVNGGLFDESVHSEVCKIVAGLNCVKPLLFQGMKYYRARPSGS